MSEIEKRIQSLEERVKVLEEAILSASKSGDSFDKKKRQSAKEYLMTKKLKSETQKALALGYFLEYIEGLESFNITDLETAFRSAKEKPPKNMNDAVNKNIAHGFLMDAASKKNGKKAWVLTATGEKRIQNNSDEE